MKTNNDWIDLLDADDVERFMSKVQVTPTCWLWTGTTYQGYGRFGIRNDDQPRSLRAHRVSWAIHKEEPLAADLVLDHICRVRSCVNPEHLRQVTPGENVLAGIGESAINARRTHCINGHELTEENVYVQPSRPQSRSCRICHREAARKYQAEWRARERVIDHE